MIRCWHIIALGLIVLCSASTPALSQGRRAGPSERPEPLGAYVFQTEEEARQREEAADLRDRVSRVEGHLQAIEEATKQAAAAGENAAKASQDVITTIGTCTKFITGLIAFIGVVLGFFGYRELKGIEAVRVRAEDALRKTEESGKAARHLVQIIDNLRKRAEADIAAATKVDPTREVTDEQRVVLEGASRAADRLEDLGQELSPQAHVVRGNDYFAREEYDRALTEYDRAIVAEPGFALAHYNRGALLLQLGRREEALAAFDRAIEFAPDYAVAYYNRACAYSRLGRQNEALGDLRKAIELDSENREMARTDRDFASLDSDPDFRKLVGLAEEESA